MDFKSFGLSGTSQSSRSLLSSSTQMMQSAASGMSQGSKTVSLGLGSLTKSVSGAVSSLPSLSTDVSKKKQEERQQQIALVMSLLEDVRLQSPAVHTGFVVAFSTATVSPVNNAGIKFRWFKMNSLVADQFHQVDESSRAWYPPTADDIGCKICVQCEDKLGQGFSRYIESAVIDADPVLSSIVESALEREYFEVKDTGVTIGTTEREFDTDSSMSSIPVGEEKDSSSGMFGVDIRSRPTSLSNSAPFLPFEGRSFVEVDSDGIFISLPMPPLSSAGSGVNSGSNSSGSGLGGGSASDVSSAAKKVRRGLHIASSEGITVHCTQPVSLVLDIPITREPTISSGTSGGEEGDMLGRIVLPWTYIRELQPTRSLGSVQTAEQIEEEELEASSFANMLMSLEQLMSGLSNSCTHVKICISCGDRSQRDALACVIRGVNCQPLGATMEDRLAVMPWNIVKHAKSKEADGSASSSDNAKVIDKANSIQELAKRLKELEHENAQLRKERYEIPTTPVHLQGRRGSKTSNLDFPLPTVTESSDEASEPSNNNACTNNTHSSSSAYSSNAATASHTDTSHAITGDDSHSVEGLRSKSEDSAEGSLAAAEDSQESMPTTHFSSNSAFAASEATRMLSAKVLELEKKLAVSARREAEAVKLRQAVDARTNTVAAENERVKAAIIVMEAQTTEATAELLSVRQQCKDLKDTLEKECEEHAQARVLVRELDELKPTLAIKDTTIKELTASLEQATSELETLRPFAGQLELTLKLEREDAMQKQEAAANRIQELEALLAKVTAEKEEIGHIADLLVEENAKQKQLLQEAEAVAAENEERARTIDKLSGEINHLHKRTESQGRDLKRVMKENAATLSEFEKALIRKSGECDDLGFKMLALKDQVTYLTQELQEAQQSRVGNLLRNLTVIPVGGSSGAEAEEAPSSTAASILYGGTSSTAPAHHIPASGGGSGSNQSANTADDSTLSYDGNATSSGTGERRLSIAGSEAVVEGMKQGMKGFFTQISKMKNLAPTIPISTNTASAPLPAPSPTNRKASAAAMAMAMDSHSETSMHSASSVHEDSIGDFDNEAEEHEI